MVLFHDTKEDDIKQRLNDLEEYVGNIERSRCNIAVRLNNVEKMLGVPKDVD